MLPGDMFQKSTIVSCPRIVCTVIRVLQFTCHVMLFFAYSPTATKAISKKKVIIDLTFFSEKHVSCNEILDLLVG